MKFSPKTTEVTSKDASNGWYRFLVYDPTTKVGAMTLNRKELNLAYKWTHT